MVRPINDQRTSQPYQHSFPFGGYEGKCNIYLPYNYDPSKLYPLIFYFHGNGGTAIGMEDLNNMDYAVDTDANGGMIVAYLQGRSLQWDLDPTSQYNDIIWCNTVLGYLLDYNIWPIDPTKLFLMGYSQGGGMATATFLSYPGQWAGVATIADNLNPNTIASVQNNTQQNPMLLFHGTADPVSAYYGNTDPEKGNVVYSAYITAQTWAIHTGCANAENPTITTMPGLLNTGEVTTDTITDFGVNANGMGVKLYTVTGGGHTIPGGLQNQESLGAVSKTVMSSMLAIAYLRNFSKPA